jgi:uncharacterized secreted protein with C-terminal beta-propeller domain
MKRVVGLVFVSLSVFILAALPSSCGSGSGGLPGDIERIGASDFVSASGSRYYSGGGGDAGSASDGGSGSPSDGGRLIEEGDIWKLSGDNLFVLNQYRGLQVFDLASIEKPKLLTSVPLRGRPVEMYIRDGNAYVIISNYFSDWMDAITGMSGEFRGSMLAIYSIKNPGSPGLIGMFNMPGDITDSRIVGEVMYLVSNRYSYYSYYSPGGGSSSNGDETLVYSVNIADPSAVTVAEMEHFARNGGYENHVAVTENLLFVATPTLGYTDRMGNYRNEYGTQITLVDISDPAGKMQVGRSFMLDGFVNERWQMDFRDGVLRVVAPEHSWGNSSQFLFAYRIKSRDSVERVYTWEIPLPRLEALKSTRFDGDRAYVVTYFQKDPLFILDLSDPAHPSLAGQLEMPGWLDFMEPRGDRLVALGRDDSAGGMTLAVSVFDVSDPANPSLTSRVKFGDGWGFTAADKDDMQKIFRVMDAEKLILIPYSGWSSTEHQYISGVQLVDWDPSDTASPLALRGMAKTTGRIQRSMLFKDRLLTYSYESFQVLDIADRDKPGVTADLDLVRNVVGFEEINGFGVETSVPLGSGYYGYGGYYPGGGAVFSTVPLDNTGTESPVARVAIDGSPVETFRDGDFLFVVTCRQSQDFQPLAVTALDYTDPANPKNLGTMDLLGTGCGHRGFHPRPGILAFWAFYHSGKIVIVDISDPAAMKISAAVDPRLPSNGYMSSFDAAAGNLYITYRTPVTATDYSYYRYYLLEIDLADPSAPVIGKPVNVPGSFLGLSANGRHLYTLDTQYDAPQGDCSGTTADGGVSSKAYGSNCYIPVYQTLNISELSGDKAYLRATRRLHPQEKEGRYYSAGDVEMNGGYAYYILGASDGKTYRSDLYVADMTNPSEIKLVARMAVPGSGLSIVDGKVLAVSRSYYYSYSGSGLMLFDLSTPAWPRYGGYHHTDGYVQEMTSAGDSLYLSLGVYGVQRIDLK